MALEPNASPAAPFEPDPAIEAYKAHVDRTLICERVARTPAPRADDLGEFARFADELARASQASRRHR